MKNRINSAAAEFELRDIKAALSEQRAGNYAISVESSNEPALSAVTKEVSLLAQAMTNREQDGVIAESKNPEHTTKDPRESKLSRILDHLPSMIGYWDANLINVHANQAYSIFFGKAPDQVIGRHMKEVLGSEIFDNNQPYIEGVLAGEEQTFERAIPSPDGKFLKHTLARYIPDRQSDKVIGFFVIVTDVSELKDRKNKLKLVFETMNEGLVISDSQGRVVQYNPASLSLLGITEDQLLGKTAKNIKAHQEIEWLKLSFVYNPRDE